MTARVFAEKGEVAASIGVTEKHVLLVVATLRHMVRHARKDAARSAGHVILVEGEPADSRILSSVPIWMPIWMP
jgi:hypothetical protein